MMRRLWFLIVLVALVLLLACGGSSAPTQLVLDSGSSVIHVCIDAGSGDVRVIGPDGVCDEEETLVLLMTPPSVHVSDDIEEFHIPGGVHAPNGGFKVGNTTTYKDGSIILSPGTNLNIDAGTLFVDTTKNWLGIGTTLPTSALDVAGDIHVSGTIKAKAFQGDGSRLRGVVSELNAAQIDAIAKAIQQRLAAELQSQIMSEVLAAVNVKQIAGSIAALQGQVEAAATAFNALDARVATIEAKR